MNWMVLPNPVCLIVKLYNNRPELLPDSNGIIPENYPFLSQKSSIFSHETQLFTGGWCKQVYPSLKNIIWEKVEIGDTIRIIRMNDDGGKDLQTRRYNGRSGVVEHIDAIGQIHGTWGGLAVIPGVDDFEVID